MNAIASAFAMRHSPWNRREFTFPTLTTEQVARMVTPERISPAELADFHHDVAVIPSYRARVPQYLPSRNRVHISRHGMCSMSSTDFRACGIHEETRYSHARGHGIS